MSPDELRDALLATRIHDPRPCARASGSEVCFRSDTEGWHGEADRLLVKALREAGYAEAVDIYDACERWYA